MVFNFPEEEGLEWQFSPKVAPYLLQVTRTWVLCTDVCPTLGAGPQDLASPESAVVCFQAVQGLGVSLPSVFAVNVRKQSSRSRWCLPRGRKGG